MKHVIFLGLLLLGCISYAQSGGSGFGIRAGVNYTNTGKISIDDITTLQPDGKLGYHVGIWGRLGDTAYMRPELVFTEINSSYSGEGFDEDFKMQKLDLPILFGHKFLRIFHGFIGPAFQYVLKTDLKDIELSDVENEFTVGFQIGGGVNFGKIGIDLRYERGFSPNYINLIGDVEGVRLDTRPTQLILGLSYKF